ncbi:hypothetical protein ACTTBJ_21620, partial [Shewanella frigidimarina]|uniref:hypothetical protein n=1 Tax=Shewanella frigidimarina TaxID=56812 RepID=UPI003F9FF2B2
FTGSMHEHNEQVHCTINQCSVSSHYDDRGGIIAVVQIQLLILKTTQKIEHRNRRQQKAGASRLFYNLRYIG